MLHQKLITIGKLKQAYLLTPSNISELLEALVPDKVFPYAIWQRAYEKFWASTIRVAMDCYRIEAPQFPTVSTLANEGYSDFQDSIAIENFFGNLLRTIKSTDLANGLNYILEAAYEDEFPHNEEKDAFFFALSQEEWNQRNRSSGHLKIESIGAATNYSFISASFIDTVAVDKKAAILQLDYLGCSLRREVKGISHALVKSILAEKLGQTETDTTEQQQTSKIPSCTCPISLPRSLWAGKTPEAIYAALNAMGLAKLEIAHVIFHKRGFKGKRAIGKLLHDTPHLSESAYDKYGKDLYYDSKSIMIIDKDDL